MFEGALSQLEYEGNEGIDGAAASAAWAAALSARR
jgi:hypothetical protein